MDDREDTRIFVRKPRQPYSGMVLDSIFGLLLRAVVIIVIIGIAMMLLTFSQ